MDPFRRLVEHLEAQGLAEQAKGLKAVLDGVWTTSSELLGEAGLELRKIKKLHGRFFSAETRSAFEESLKAVRRAGWR